MSPRMVYLLFFAGAAAIVGGTVLAAFTMPSLVRAESGCTHALPGLQAAAPRSDAWTVAQERGKWVATHTFLYDLPAGSASAVHACTGTGTVALVAHEVSGVVVEAKVVGRAGSEAAAREAASKVPHAVRSSGSSLEAAEGRWSAGWWGGSDGGVSFRILVPAAANVRADLSSGTGTVLVDGARLRGLDASAGTGSLDLTPSWAEGDLDLSAGTGKVSARFPALGPARVHVSTGTGSIDLKVPADERHGYDIDASTGTGSIDLQLPGLPPAEEEDRFGPGGHREARTEGFESRPVQVTMDLSTGTGSIRVSAS